MNILVLMAGEGQRFQKAGYEIPKPLIEYDGISILERTTSCCPLISHRSDQQTSNLMFACRSEHNENQSMDSFLQDIYKNPTIKYFDKTTRGNLETAYLTLLSCDADLDSPLIVLDADNVYSDPNFTSNLMQLQTRDPCMGIFVFNDLLREAKWANADITDDGMVKDIKEKDSGWTDKPALIGVFYFSSTKLFLQYAHYILNNLNTTRGEYFVSQVPQLYARLQYNVYAYKVKNVIPLGTPEDFEDAIEMKVLIPPSL